MPLTALEPNGANPLMRRYEHLLESSQGYREFGALQGTDANES